MQPLSRRAKIDKIVVPLPLPLILCVLRVDRGCRDGKATRGSQRCPESSRPSCSTRRHRVVSMDTAMDMYYTLRDMRKRQLAHQVLNLAMIVCSALMIWKSLMVITESDSPVVVVLRCSNCPMPATPSARSLALRRTLPTLTRAAHARSQWEHGAGLLPRRHLILAHGLHTLPCRRHRGLQGGRS